MNKDRLFQSLNEEATTLYMTAVAQTTTPDEFAAVVDPLARRDSYQSLTGEVYATACRLANIAQKEKLEAEVKHLNIRTEHRRKCLN